MLFSVRIATQTDIRPTNINCNIIYLWNLLVKMFLPRLYGSRALSLLKHLYSGIPFNQMCILNPGAETQIWIGKPLLSRSSWWSRKSLLSFLMQLSEIFRLAILEVRQQKCREITSNTVKHWEFLCFFWIQVRIIVKDKDILLQICCWESA